MPLEQQDRIARNLERFKIGVEAHDRENPSHNPAYGIGLSRFDMDCLGFDDGERLWAGITIHCDGGTTGNFRVLCGTDHKQPAVERVEQLAKA